MRTNLFRRALLLATMMASVPSLVSSAEPGAIDHSAASILEWRCIGPFRGGRTVGAAGIADQPNTFFIGVNNGGVWKTTDAGRTWNPIFDDQPTGSIGALALAPSNPQVIYVGSGEGLQRPDLSVGDGMYRSDDGGKTWKHLGLRDGQQIASIIVDQANPMRLFVGVLGHPYGPNQERGVFRSLDGGETFENVLFKDPDTGAMALAFDPADSSTIYADLFESRHGPWENGTWQGPGSGLYKSTDGGTSWRQLRGGLPDAKDGLGRIGFDIARTNPRRIYATVDAPEKGGIYRSDDGGESWTMICNQRRLWGRGFDFAEIRVDPTDANTVYVANTSTYRSTDAGVTWTCIKGAPGGDDYHTIWINPKHPEIMLLAADQGATITVNAGATWSSWYNQPTAQLFHVATDNQVPYSVYGGQQESGSVGITSRGDDGQITFREWHPAGGDEYAYLAPDPLHPDVVYGGKVLRYHKSTHTVEQVGPDREKLGLRFVRTAPLVFSPAEPDALYLGSQFLLRTRDEAATWDVISPDLSRESFEVPETVGKYRTSEMQTMPRRGVIYTVAPSPLSRDLIWCGTDDGLIHVTPDGGKTWKNVTPAGLGAWSKVSLIDAGHFDPGTAYAAVNRLRLDDLAPHIYRTHDGGVTWKEITGDLPAGPVNVVREDPERRGLLFCGTELAVFFSLDDGEHWHLLRRNMPATSIRDLVVHGDDLVIATHGRSFWIMDHFDVLRSMPRSGERAALFASRKAYQFERNTNTDTPLPPEEPAGKNPPDGAVIDYWLEHECGVVAIEIVDSRGEVVRRLSTEDPVVEVSPESLTVLPGWLRPALRVGRGAGGHRVVWNLRRADPPREKELDRTALPISAIWNDTPMYPQGDWVPKGTYTVRLIADGVTVEQKLEVEGDPRKAGWGVERAGPSALDEE